MSIHVFMLSNPLVSFFMAQYAELSINWDQESVYIILNSNDKKYSDLCILSWDNLIDKQGINIIYVNDFDRFYDNKFLDSFEHKDYEVIMHIGNSINLRRIKKKIKKINFVSYEHGISDVFYLYNLENLQSNKFNLIARLILLYTYWKWPVSKHVSICDSHKKVITKPTIISIDQKIVHKNLFSLDRTNRFPKVDVVLLMDNIDVFEETKNRILFVDSYLNQIFSDISSRLSQKNRGKIKVLIKSRAHSKKLKDDFTVDMDKFSNFEVYLTDDFICPFEPIEFLWPYIKPKILYSNGLSAPYFLKNLGFLFEYVNTTKLLIDSLNSYEAKKEYIDLIEMEYKRNHKLLKNYTNLFPDPYFLKRGVDNA